MAHSPHTKARAMAALLLGDTPRHVAKEMGIPLTTVRRWRPEACALLREVLPDFDPLADARRLLGMAPKKTTQCNS